MISKLKIIGLSILSIISGLFIGGLVNGAIVAISGSIIPYPKGYDNTTLEGFKETFHLLETKHFIMPFLAHAFGTFIGALIAALIGIKYKMMYALCIGSVFLFGGIYMVILVPSPVWFTILDLGLAYIPMAFLAAKIISSKK